MNKVGKIIVESDRGAVPSNSRVGVIAKIQIIPAGTSELNRQQAHAQTKNIILLDNSGSMSGDKLNQAKEAAIQYYKSLKEGDTITISTFSDTINVLLKDELPFQTSLENVVRGIDSDGGTNMYAALKEVEKIISISTEPKGRSSFKLVLLTDGVASDGSENEFKEISSKFTKMGVPLYIFGIGGDYNEDLLIKMYRANEIGFFTHLTNITDVVKDFKNISKQIVLYPSRELTIKLTPGSKLSKIYKSEPQIVELDPKRSGDNLYTIPLGNLGIDNHTVLARIEVPERSSGEFREGSFSVDMDSPTIGILIVKRSDDLNYIKQSINEAVKLEFKETELKILGSKALDKSDTDHAEAGRIFTKKLEQIKNDPIMTKKIGDANMKQFVDAQNIIMGTKKVTGEELKERKSIFTKRRD